MSLYKTIKFITNHPLNSANKVRAISRFAYWQIISRITGGWHVKNFAETSKIWLKSGLAGATGNYYCGLHEFEDMSFLLHFLRRDDEFVDIGANIGSYSILGANEIGAQTLSFEPVEHTADILKKNIKLNDIGNLVKLYECALGFEEGHIAMTTELDTCNHVVVSQKNSDQNIPVKVFDKIHTFDRPCLIKIDVEGFEFNVLRGMENNLLSGFVKAMIIELNGSGEKYGFNDTDLDKWLNSIGFKAFAYKPFERQLQPITKKMEIPNRIYIRDVEFVKQRIKNARLFKIKGHQI